MLSTDAKLRLSFLKHRIPIRCAVFPKVKCIADDPWERDGIRHASSQTTNSFFQNDNALIFSFSLQMSQVYFLPYFYPFVYFNVSYATDVLTVIFLCYFPLAISSLTNIHTSLQKLIPTEMMRAKARWSILPMVKPPSAAKGGSALPVLQGAGLLLSPHHEAVEG